MARSAVRRRYQPATTPGRVPPRSPAIAEPPPVAELLDVDREYRRQAAAGRLRTIAPHRLNPDGVAWLPILHTDRGGRKYTALYSNTARAHRLHRTRDWVVVYYGNGGGEHQVTVVTEHGGPLRGRRVVRGREEACFQHYDLRPLPDPRGHTDGNGVI